MVNIILISHGSFCEGMLDGLKMIGGSDYGVRVLPLFPGTSPEAYRASLAELIEASSDNLDSGTIILCDIAGGTPYLSAAYLAKKYKLAVIAGMNMPMILTLALERDEETTLESLVDKAQSTYKRAYKAIEFGKGEKRKRAKLSFNKNR